MKVALALGVLSALCCSSANAATANYEYDWRALEYDQFTSNRPKRFDGTMFGTNTTDSYKCIHFDCLARNSNQALYSQYSGDSWTRRCMLPVNDTTYLQPCNNETDRCLYLEGSQDAVCVNFYEINNITELMPGDSCPVEWYDRKREKCQWGTFKCINGVCEGFREGEYCSRQLDCVPGTYCFQNNTCVAEKKTGEPCVANYECARNAMCVLNQDRTNSSCIEFFSLKVGDSAAPNFAGSSVIAEELTELLCQSGTLHPTTGKCIEAPKSTNLGKKCDSDTECGTSAPGLYAKCQCYMGRANTKKCGPVRGDPEGMAELDAFKTYLQATTKYRREYEVNPKDENSWKVYSGYRCKRIQFRAKYAIESLSDLDCVKLEQEEYRMLLKDLPFFTEYSVYCLAHINKVLGLLLLLIFEIFQA